MKKIILSFIAALACLSSHADTNTTWLSGIGGFFTTNAMVTTYAIYDQTDKSFGAGIAFSKLMTDNTGITIRLDRIGGVTYRASGDFTMRTEIVWHGFHVIPFAFLGAANDGHGSVTDITGAGIALGIPKKTGGAWFLVPDDILFDYEHWNDHNQLRGGPNWKF